MDPHATRRFVDDLWARSVVPTLHDYIAIPNKSPAFDDEWRAHGHMERAVALLSEWVRSQNLPGAKVETVRLEGRTPLLIIEAEGNSDECILVYGHYDKQPEFAGWREGLGPWSPVLQNDRLYGRGGADDGYSVFAAVAALGSIAEQGAQRARCVVLIEGCEESGSVDLPHYLDALADQIGSPGLVVCLDSGCGNYEQLWGTTSLRGLVAGTLSVELLREGVHSGSASGVVASSFRVLRQLLSRIEDERSGAILPAEFHVDIPEERRRQARHLATILGDPSRDLPLLDSVTPVVPDAVELILNRTWRPTLSITGAAGIPSLESAGNVLRPRTAVKISMRIPPLCDADRASARLKEILEADPPYGAHVTFEPEQPAAGWCAPPSEPWLTASVDRASRAFWGREAAYMGEGGTIPFMAMLGEKFPAAQFFITGVLGPESNAHGPNEFLHLPMARGVTCAIAHVIADHFARAG
ncbi:MAG TPA: M20/M25/M40 family metallo-hydrolase [Chloroflexota bacterium]|nr:M20/M25/M40 family metallo-hydrolase [Chloroflexota bacterium]